MSALMIMHYSAIMRVSMPSQNEFLFMPAHELARHIAARSLSARELVTATIQRAESLQPLLNCIAVPLYDEALAAADEADAAVARGDELGPLHGIPLTIKDGIATAGHLLTFGSTPHSSDVSSVDDIVWQRLRAAGAILLGKTTTPEYFHKVVTDSSLFGITRNPWSLDHTPGGSSGGAAAALAAGIGSIAVGSDGGGSLRCPASCTGTIAIKPTMGRIPHAHFPETFGNYSTLGPMARDARDLAHMLATMSGAANDDVHSLGIPPLLLDSPLQEGRPVRIGWLSDPGNYGSDLEVTTLVWNTLKLLASEQTIVDQIDGAFLAGAFDTYVVIASVGHASRARNESKTRQAQWTQSFKSIVERGLSYTASDLYAAQQGRTALFRRTQSVFDTIDIIAMPTLNAPPKTVDAEGSVESVAYAAWAGALYPFNLTGHPAISIPCGFTESGLPVGLQLVAPWYGEARLLHIAAAIQHIKPWTGRRPAI